jgi:hypothetical protein
LSSFSAYPFHDFDFGFGQAIEAIDDFVNQLIRESRYGATRGRRNPFCAFPYYRLTRRKFFKEMTNIKALSFRSLSRRRERDTHFAMDAPSSQSCSGSITSATPKMGKATGWPP